MSHFQRWLSYLLNQVLVDTLANSRIFQRFAIRSNQFFTDVAKKGAENKDEAVNRGSEFFKVFKEEMTKGLRELQHQQPPKQPPKP